jgi:hypothetical protein
MKSCEAGFYQDIAPSGCEVDTPLSQIALQIAIEILVLAHGKQKQFVLIIFLAAYAAPAWCAPFHSDLELQGIKFTIDCPNSGSLNKLTSAQRASRVTTNPSPRKSTARLPMLKLET